MNKLDKDYKELLGNIIDTGIRKLDRTGTGTISTFGRQIRHNMADGFPLLTTKKMYFSSIVTELLWFLKGDTHLYSNHIKQAKEQISRQSFDLPTIQIQDGIHCSQGTDDIKLIDYKSHGVIKAPLSN